MTGLLSARRYRVMVGLEQVGWERGPQARSLTQACSSHPSLTNTQPFDGEGLDDVYFELDTEFLEVLLPPHPTPHRALPAGS